MSDYLQRIRPWTASAIFLLTLLCTACDKQREVDSTVAPASAQQPPPKDFRELLEQAGALVTSDVDGTVRDIDVDTCSACGTKYKLGAGTGSAVILASDGPPEGGAAVA